MHATHLKDGANKFTQIIKRKDRPKLKDCFDREYLHVGLWNEESGNKKGLTILNSGEELDPDKVIVYVICEKYWNN